MNAALILFRFLQRGEIYDSFYLGHVMGFTVGSTYLLQLLRNYYRKVDLSFSHEYDSEKHADQLHTEVYILPS